MDTIEKMKKQRRNAAIIAICFGLVFFLILAIMIGGMLHTILTMDYLFDMDAVSDHDICTGHLQYSRLNTKSTEHTFSCGKAAGGWTIAEYTAQNTSGCFKISSLLESGEMRLYLVKNNAEIIAEIPANQTFSYVYNIEETTTTYSLRILCSDATNLQVYTDNIKI